MRPRKPSKLDAVVQVNLRVNEELRRQLERAAEEHHVTFSQEVRARLEATFKANESLADLLANWERKMRDTVERSAPKADIERTWDRLRDVGATLAHTYTGVEGALGPFLKFSEVRALIRGAQQEQKKGGNP